MTTYGAVHELVVEYEDVGPVDDPQENARGSYDSWGYELRYILRHPSEGCWESHEKQHADSECPVLRVIKDEGFEDALRLTSSGMRGGRYRFWTAHLEDGVYHVQCWAQRYSGPEGDDWDGGLYVERVDQEPASPPAPSGFHLVKEDQ